MTTGVFFMRKFIGFAILVFFTLVLFISSLINLWHIHYAFFLAFLLIVVFAGYRIFAHYQEVLDISKSYGFTSKPALYDFLATFFGAVITFVLSVYLGLGAVLASGIIGMLAALFLKPYAVPIFCGSFLGMSSPELLEPLVFILAALIAGGIFVLSKDVFNGFGGKLGTISLSSVLVTSFILSQTYLEAPIFDDFEMVLIVFFAMIGALLTFILNIRFQQGPVLASGFVGLIFGALLPVFFPEIGVTLAIVAFGASFVGMSNTKRMHEESLIIFAGLLFGLIYIFSAPYFGGAGGKLGTIAFASVLSVSGLRMGLRKIIT